MRYAIVLAFFLSSQVFAIAGMISVISHKNVPQTVKSLRVNAKKFGFTTLMEVNHGANAQKITGRKVTEGKLLILDHPKYSGNLLQQSETIGVDLPLKVFTFRDKDNQVWITYPDPRSIAARHNVGDSTSAERLSDVLASLTLVAATLKGKRK